MLEIYGHLSIIFDAHCRNGKIDWKRGAGPGLYAVAPSRCRAFAFFRLWLLFWISKLKMTEIHGHLNKKSTCTFPKSRNRLEKGGGHREACEARVRKRPDISIRSVKRTVAILAQGTSWADAATQAFLQKSLKVKSSSLPGSVFGCLVLLLFGCCPCCAAPIVAIHELCARSLMALHSLSSSYPAVWEASGRALPRRVALHIAVECPTSSPSTSSVAL
jgi:hypothetical protein